MRIVALIFVIVTLLVGAFFGFCYYGAQMQILGVSVTLTPVPEALGTYNEVLASLDNGSFMGTLYYQPDFGAPEEYTFSTLTVHMSNRGAIPMDWVRIEVTPGTTDILQLAEERTPTLAPGTRSDFSTILLSRTDADVNRRITVTYYVLGNPLSVVYDMRNGG